MVGHAGARLLADLADATGLSTAMSDALAPLRQRESGHDPGRVAVDLAVMLADGGEAIADLAVLRNQSRLFGPVASDRRRGGCWPRIDDAALARSATARARAREVAWAQAAETGRLPSLDGGRVHRSRVWCWTSTPRGDLPLREGAGGQDLEEDASATTRCCASSMPPAKRCPVCSGRQRRIEHGRRSHHGARPGVGADPRRPPYGNDILIRCDSAGASHAFLDHIRGLREHGIRTFFSVGAAITEPDPRRDHRLPGLAARHRGRPGTA